MSGAGQRAGQRAWQRAWQRARLYAQAGRYYASFARWLYFAPLTRWPREPSRAELLRWVQRCAHRTFEVFELPFSVEGDVAAVAALPNAIYVMNHRSWLDQPAMIAAAPHLLHFLGNAKYFEFPVLGRVLRTFGCFPVQRGQASQLTDRLRRCLEDGGSLAVYPEGTRSRDGAFLPFRSGAYVLAAQTGVPVVPLYLYGAFEALPPERPFRELRRGPLRVRVGAPFAVPASFLDAVDVGPYRDAYIAEWQAHA
ncbi:MAG: lysophospholipid acyltransferase family protein [bacterium]